MKAMAEKTKGNPKIVAIPALVKAWEVGQKTEDVDICLMLFPCEEKDFSFLSAGRQARITCPNTAELCPGYSISCAVCALFLPEACAAVCPITALYCGVAGYACNEEKPVVEPPVEEEVERTKREEPKVEKPKVEKPNEKSLFKTDEPKEEKPKEERTKREEPKVEEPKEEEPKVEKPKEEKPNKKSLFKTDVPN